MVSTENVIDLYKKNFLEYASYVIRDRALPELADGLKPVQRRILFSLFEMDDGRFHKVANVIGHTMRYHPHGDAAIGDALVVLANKNYFIEKQGNFGNIFTGDPASAARYIECRLTDLAKDVLFNREITEFLPSYDGRHKEPVVFPCKIPYSLLQGTEGIAVGMATRILPHNFNEVLEAQIACLESRPFRLFPDFQQGGILDVSEYEDGAGKVRIRARIEIKNHKTLVIREVPYGISSERLINSVEDAIRKNRVKLSSISDFTAEFVEIELSTQRGVTAEEVLERLYAYTDCEVTVHSNINLIKEGMPGALSVSEIVVRSTERLVALLKAELKILIRKLSDRLHGRTLEQIFIEHRIYKVIENAESLDAAKKAVEKALKPYTRDLERPVTDEDIERLLEIPIKKIARFDVLKNADEIRELKKRIKTETNHLNAIKKFTIQFLRGLIKKHGPVHPRRSRIDSFETVSARDLKDTDSRVYYDRKSGFIGTRVKGESRIDCSSFDKLLLINQKGILKVVPVPDKIFCDKLVHFDVIDKEQVFNLVSRDRKTAACYVKRFRVDKFIQNKEYPFLDPGHRLEAFTAREGMLISAEYDRKIKDKPSSERFPFEDFPVRGPRNRGLKLGTRKIRRVALRSPSR